MTTKQKVPGAEAAAASTSSSTKNFDPDKFQAHKMPPGFLGELLALELPSMPKERIEETIPPTSAAALFATRSSPVDAIPPKNESGLSSRPPSRLLSPRLALLGILVLIAFGGLLSWLWGREIASHPGATVASTTEPSMTSPVQAPPATVPPSNVRVEGSAPPAERKAPRVSPKPKKNVIPEPPPSRVHFEEPE